MVYANPGVLLSSIERSLMPKIRWLAAALQMDEDQIFDMIRRRVAESGAEVLVLGRHGITVVFGGPLVGYESKCSCFLCSERLAGVVVKGTNEWPELQ